MTKMCRCDTVKDNESSDELKDMDISNMTPLDSLNTLYRLQNKIKMLW